MKTKRVVSSITVMIFFFLLVILTAVALPLGAGADEIRISSLGGDHIGKEVTVSGVIIAIASNIEPLASTDEGIQTFEPGDTGVLTLNDGIALSPEDTITVCCDPRLLEKFYEGQRVTVTGVYAGQVEEGTDKGLIYADALSTDVTIGYADVTVAELTEFPQDYYDEQVRIKGTVTRMETIPGETELTIDDGTGTMDVEYRAEMENVTIGDEVIVEGKFYRNKIYAFDVWAPESEPEEMPEPSLTPSSTPVSSPSPTPAPAATATPSIPVEEEEGMPLYVIVAIIAIVALVGVVLSFKVRDWLMIRRYGK